MTEIKLEVCVYRHCSPSYIHNIFFTNNHLKRRSITTVMIRWTEPFTVSDFVIRFCLFSLPSAPTNWSQREYFFFILTSFLISFFLSVSFIVYKHNEGLLIIKCSTSHICLCGSSESQFWRGIPGISGHTVRDLWWTKWQWSTSVFVSLISLHQTCALTSMPLRDTKGLTSQHLVTPSVFVWGFNFDRAEVNWTFLK